MQITVNDRKSYALDSKRVYTDEGFLRVPGKAARIGIQEYLACELGLKDRAPTDIIRVYRPADQVFDEDSLATYLGSDVTNDHPSQLVNSDTYKNDTVGVVVSAGRQDGDFVVVDMIIKDKKAIKTVESGKCELSAGYTSMYDMRPGVTPDGESYDAMQTQIKINHVAIVDRARAGAMARIFDSKRGRVMFKIDICDGVSIEVEDAKQAEAIQFAMTKANEASKALDAAAAKTDAVQAQLDSANEKIAKLELECSDEAIKTRVASIAQVSSDARKVAGETFSCDSVDVLEIKRAAMAVKRPSLDWASKSEAYVEAAFDMAKEDDEEEESKDAGGSAPKPRTSGDSKYVQLSQDAASVAKVSEDSFAARKKALASAWKGAK